MRNAIVVLLLTFVITSAAVGKTVYVDCAAGSDSGAGTSEQTAWKTLQRVSDTTFAPGDSILLRRGTRCSGSLSPKGSGEDGRPIRIGAYGDGPLPVIEAGSAEAAVNLVDQHGWEIEHLETSGGNHFGIYVGATKKEKLTYYRIRNVVVHDVAGTVKEKRSGLVVVSGENGAVLEDIIIEGVTAYNTTQWAGIYASGVRNVTIRNSIVHHVYGDGIVIFSAENGVIEKSAAWLTGLQPTETIGTPNGIWTWSCTNCIVQNTEGFWTDSPGVDGGVYDIDWGNHDNVVQYNYAHDAQGYCLAVFGAGKLTTTNSVLRYNVCVNNGRSPKLARRQGDLYTSTWEGGSLDGVLIYNNTFFWNPPIDTPAFNLTETQYVGSRPNRVFNNLVYSTVPSMSASVGQLKFQNNLYWYSGSSAPRWSHDGREHVGLAGYRGIAPDERSQDPMLDFLLRPRKGSPLIGAGVQVENRGAHDAFGEALPGNDPDIGALRFRPATVTQEQKAPEGLPREKNKWMLLLFAKKAAGADARSVLVFVQAALAQYGDTSLEAGFISDDAATLKHDWNFSQVKPIEAGRFESALGLRATPTLLLISPDRTVVRRWEGFVSPAELGLTLKQHLGPAAGDPPLLLRKAE